MKRFLNRLVYRSPGRFHNPLMHPFLLITLASGIAFVFFPHTAPVQASVLHQLTVGHLPDVAISIWGIAALFLSLLHLVAIQVRRAWLGNIVTWFGVLLWLYAALVFALYGFWLQFFTSGVPNLWFWVWYRQMVRAYHRDNEKAPH